MKYRITVLNGKPIGERPQFVVEAANYGEAADKACRKLVGGKTRAHQVTGDPGKSGIFQAFTTGNPQHSRGYQFHVF